MKQTTLQSLSGSDSGESTQVAPLHAKVSCPFRYRHLDTLSSGGYRLWLGCVPGEVAVKEEKIDDERSPAQAAQKLPFKRGTFQLTCSPAPDKVIVGGARGERVVEGGSTAFSVELRDGDDWVELRKQRYQPKRIPIGEWEHGASLSEAVLLDPEI